MCPRDGDLAWVLPLGLLIVQRPGGGALGRGWREGQWALALQIQAGSPDILAAGWLGLRGGWLGSPGAMHWRRGEGRQQGSGWGSPRETHHSCPALEGVTRVSPPAQCPASPGLACGLSSPGLPHLWEHTRHCCPSMHVRAGAQSRVAGSQAVPPPTEPAGLGEAAASFAWLPFGVRGVVAGPCGEVRLDCKERLSFHGISCSPPLFPARHALQRGVLAAQRAPARGHGGNRPAKQSSVH